MKEFLYQNMWHMSTPHFDNNTAIGVWNPKIFKIVKTYYTLEDLYEYEQIQEFKEIEKQNLRDKYSYLKQRSNKETANAWIAEDLKDCIILSKEEAENLLNELKRPISLEEKLKVLRIVRSINRPGWKEAAKTYKKQLQKEFGLDSKQLSKLL